MRERFTCRCVSERSLASSSSGRVAPRALLAGDLPRARACSTQCTPGSHTPSPPSTAGELRALIRRAADERSNTTTKDERRPLPPALDPTAYRRFPSHHRRGRLFPPALALLASSLSTGSALALGLSRADRRVPRCVERSRRLLPCTIAMLAAKRAWPRPRGARLLLRLRTLLPRLSKLSFVSAVTNRPAAVPVAVAARRRISGT